MTKDEIVLVIGGSGFIGQHLIKLLLEQKENLNIKEVRTIDITPYSNKIDCRRNEELTTFVGDICKPETLEKAFIGVKTVFHCAAYVSIQFPPNYKELDRVNVDGTRSVVDLCLRYNVKRLVYTSCASVCFTPFKGHSTFSIIINQTESKALVPVHDIQKSSHEFDKHFLIPGYSSSKLRAENIVLNSAGATLNNQNEYLQTVAIRPPLTYGEGDNHFMPPILEYLSKRNNVYPRIAGSGGKQQLAYAGNIAWGHICAYRTLKENPTKISGLPVFVTDDTPINDIARFIQKVGAATNSIQFKTSFWYLPHFVFFLLALIFEMFVKVLNPITNIKLRYSLRVIASFTASVIFYNRLRAAIHMDYEPIFDGQKSLERSSKWYEEWCRRNVSTSIFNKEKKL